jgi:hypothetical protein
MLYSSVPISLFSVNRSQQTRLSARGREGNWREIQWESSSQMLESLNLAVLRYHLKCRNVVKLLPASQVGNLYFLLKSSIKTLKRNSYCQCYSTQNFSVNINTFNTTVVPNGKCYSRYGKKTIAFSILRLWGELFHAEGYKQKAGDNFIIISPIISHLLEILIVWSNL